MNNNRDCQHGRRNGNCDTCDLIDAQKVIAELKATLEQQHLLITMLERHEVELTAEKGALTAQVEQLRDVLIELQGSAEYWSEYDVPIGIRERINEALSKEPARYLAERDAEVAAKAVEDSIKYFAHRADKSGESAYFAHEYANKLRQQAKP